MFLRPTARGVTTTPTRLESSRPVSSSVLVRSSAPSLPYSDTPSQNTAQSFVLFLYVRSSHGVRTESLIMDPSELTSLVSTVRDRILSRLQSNQDDHSSVSPTQPPPALRHVLASVSIPTPVRQQRPLSSGRLSRFVASPTSDRHNRVLGGTGTLVSIPGPPPSRNHVIVGINDLLQHSKVSVCDYACMFRSYFSLALCMCVSRETHIVRLMID